MERYRSRRFPYQEQRRWMVVQRITFRNFSISVMFTLSFAFFFLMDGTIQTNTLIGIIGLTYIGSLLSALYEMVATPIEVVIYEYGIRVYTLYDLFELDIQGRIDSVIDVKRTDAGLEVVAEQRVWVFRKKEWEDLESLGNALKFQSGQW